MVCLISVMRCVLVIRLRLVVMVLLSLLRSVMMIIRFRLICVVILVLGLSAETGWYRIQMGIR